MDKDTFLQYIMNINKTFDTINSTRIYTIYNFMEQIINVTIATFTRDRF